MRTLAFAIPMGYHKEKILGTLNQWSLAECRMESPIRAVETSGKYIQDSAAF